jgi:phosphatidate cytidylyltransferase
VILAEQRAGRWGDLAVRVASAAVLAPLGLAAIWLGGIWWDLVLTAAAVGLGCEWALLSGSDLRASEGILVPICVAIAVLGAERGPVASGLASLLTLTVFAPLLTRRPSVGVGILYVGLGAIALVYLRNAPSGLADLLLVVLVVWGCDIGAYVTGRLIGGRKLAPRLSPGKTWSGAAGGLVCGTLSGVAVAAGFHAPPPGLAAAAAVSAVLSVAAQAGDLLESAIKRHFGKKDSGNLIPGHGGLFDRLDGLIAAAPVACLLSLGAIPGQAIWMWGIH